MELSPKLLQLTQEDLELYQDEPQDFITKYYSNTDYFGECATIRMEVSEFISHISKVRAGNILTDYVNFLVQMLDQYLSFLSLLANVDTTTLLWSSAIMLRRNGFSMFSDYCPITSFPSPCSRVISYAPLVLLNALGNPLE